MKSFLPWEGKRCRTFPFNSFLPARRERIYWWNMKYLKYKHTPQWTCCTYQQNTFSIYFAEFWQSPMTLTKCINTCWTSFGYADNGKVICQTRHVNEALPITFDRMSRHIAKPTTRSRFEAHAQMEDLQPCTPANR